MSTTTTLALRYPKDADTTASKTFEAAAADLANDIDAFAGAWTTLGAVTVRQGATNNITKTLDLARYRLIGKWCEFEFRIAVTGAGTASAKVDLFGGWPAAKDSGFLPIGVGGIRDTSVPTFYSAVLFLDTGTTDTWVWGAGTGKLGAAVFTAALAAGDVLHGNGWYEVA